MRDPGLVPVLVVCLVTLISGYALKAICPPQDASTYPTLCYTDVTALYGARGLDIGVLPYLDFPAEGSYQDPGFLEYPVVTGAFIAALSAISDSAADFLRVNALLLGAVALLSAAALRRLAGWLVMRWAAAPILALYAFNNWDLLAVGCVVAGCFMQARARAGWAGLWFGLGMAAKLYPVFFLAPLLVERLWAGDSRGAARAVAGGMAAFLLPNLLLALANPAGWWATYSFHSARGADLGSLWGVLLPVETGTATVNVLSALTMLIGGASVLGIGWWRAVREQAYPFVPVASALVIVFLLTSKVASPQYALWLLPSLVLLQLRLRWWVAWNAVGVLVYLVSFGVGLAGYRYDMAPDGIAVAAVARALVLGGLLVVVLRAPEVFRPRRRGEVRQDGEGRPQAGGFAVPHV